MAKTAYDMIHDIVAGGREAGWDDRQIAAGINTVLSEEGFMPGPAVNLPASNPLTSNLSWCTDFSKAPNDGRSGIYAVIRWTYSDDFSFDWEVLNAPQFKEIVARIAVAREEAKQEGKEFSRREFAWANVTVLPPAAHAAVAERLQAESDRFAKRAEDARAKAA